MVQQVTKEALVEKGLLKRTKVLKAHSIFS